MGSNKAENGFMVKINIGIITTGESLSSADTALVFMFLLYLVELFLYITLN